jgi:hypothetical protein
MAWWPPSQATFASGGSIYCTHGFNAMNFFGMMSEARPTWYTAVPTMHQAILSRAGRNADVIADVPLRFLALFLGLIARAGDGAVEQDIQRPL